MGIRDYADTQCGFKFFREQIMRQVFALQKVDGYMFDVEILLILREDEFVKLKITRCVVL